MPYFFIVLLLILSFGAERGAEAANLLFISDTISASAPSANSNHAIQFTLVNAVPASGKIVITPQSGFFTISAGLDYTDLDFLVDSTNKTLATSAGSGASGAIGADVVTGTSGAIIFTLNDTDAISAGTAIIIKIGTNADYGVAGDSQIQNPSAVGSYKIGIETKNASDALIDSADAMLAVVMSVAMATSEGVCGIADLDCDGDVDLTDFSIAAYWYQQTLSTDFAVKEVERLNGDGQVNLVDFSIMAYYYTG